MSRAVIEEIQHKFKNAQRIRVVSHIRPDGDAVGSLLGLGLALQDLGKDVQMVLSDKVPASFRHLEGARKIVAQPSGEVDLSVVVDCSDLERVGKGLSVNGRNNATGEIIPDINIDHHVTNLNFARLNLVESDAAATSEILALHFEELGLLLTRPVAEALLTGIITDTLGFRTSNMSPRVLRTAAQLVEAGADISALYHTALVERPFQAARYWGFGLSKLKRDGSMVWTTLTLEDRRMAEYPGRDDADLINVLSSIEEADVAIIFVEQNQNTVKVSWRAQPEFDVSQVALKFGGGGHKAAAGAEIQGKLEDVQEKVLKVTQELFVRKNGGN